MKTLTLVLAFLLFASVFSACNKSNNSVGPNALNQWTQVNGLPTFQNIVKVDSNLIAAGYDGVYTSTDNGANWNASSGLPWGNYNVGLIAGTVVAGDAYGQGIFVSSDHGLHWPASDSGLPQNDSVFCFSVVGSNILAGTDRGVFKSTDMGGSWIGSNSGISQLSYVCTSFAVKGTDIFVAEGYGVYLSRDNGDNWTEVDNGALTDSLKTYPVESLAISGAGIFAGMQDGVFVSTNEGGIWTATSKINASPSFSSGIQLAVVDSTVFAACGGAGLFRTTDNSGTWNSVLGNLPPPSTVVNRVVAIGNELYIATGNGTVWRQQF